MKLYSILLMLFFPFLQVAAQLPTPSPEASKDKLVKNTFTSFRMINGHSMETAKKNYLVMLVAHRFQGTVNSGIEELFGMDQFANTRLSLLYGLTNDLSIGAGRTQINKVYDGFMKYRLLKQTENKVPLSITAMAGMAIQTRDRPPLQEALLNSRHNMNYVYQLHIARKFSYHFSAQLSPVFIHRNLTLTSSEPNQLFGLGTSLKVRINDDIALVGEYYYAFKQPENLNNALALGISFETSSHVFQLHFTNATSMQEYEFMPGVIDDFFDNGVHFGFNISRNFRL